MPSTITRDRLIAVAKVLVWVLCVSIAGAILTGLATGGTQAASVPRLMEAAFGSNGLVDGELTPPPDNAQLQQQRR